MTMEESFKFYTGTIGVSVDEFYDSTPFELELKAIGFLEARKEDLELRSHAISVGVVNAMSKKKVKLFQENKELGLVSDTEKQSDLQYLENVFST